MKWLRNWKRWLLWLVAASALLLVVRAVPIRDRCADPESPGPVARVAISRDADGCTLHRVSGPVHESHVFCARLVCEPGLGSTLSHARVGLTLALFLLYFMSSLAWAARWRMLLGLAGVHMPLLAVWRVTVEAQAAGVLLPGGIGGDALRIGSAIDRGVPASIVVGSVLLDRAVGLSTLATVGFALSLLFAGADLGVFALGLALVPVGFVVSLLLLRMPAVSQRPFLRGGKIGRTVRPLLDYLGDRRAPRVIARAFVVSAVVSAIQLLVMRGLFVSLGAVPVSEKWVYLGTVIMFAVAALPALPGGWGTSDAAFVYFMGRAGLPPATALAVLLLFRAFWYATGLVGALLLLARRRAAAPSL